MLDLRHLVWDKNTNGKAKCSGGSYYKSCENGTYYKLSSGDSISGIYGHESVNECLISDILTALNIPCLTYTGERALININGRMLEAYVCISRDFKQPGEDKLPFDFYYKLCGEEGEDALSFCKRIGIFGSIEYMLLSDFLFINRDRHGANIELIKNGSSVRAAPLFDNGFPPVAPLQSNTDSIEIFDALRDREANNFLGSRSLCDNLSLIEKPLYVNALSSDELIGFIQRYAAELSPIHINKIHEIIWRCYCYARDKGILRER